MEPYYFREWDHDHTEGSMAISRHAWHWGSSWDSVSYSIISKWIQPTVVWASIPNDPPSTRLHFLTLSKIVPANRNQTLKTEKTKDKHKPKPILWSHSHSKNTATTSATRNFTKNTFGVTQNSVYNKGKILFCNNKFCCLFPVHKVNSHT